MTETTATDPAARAISLFHAWESALADKDADRILRVYHEDASIESPIIRRLLGQDEGICRGHSGIREFYEAIFAETGSLRMKTKPTVFTDGAKLMWEYTRTIPGGQEMEMAEVWNIEDDSIRRHRVFWGWAGLAIANDGVVVRGNRLG